MVDTNLATVRVGWLIDRVNLVSPPPRGQQRFTLYTV